MCISITISHWGSGNNAVIGFLATDGNRTLTGDRAWGWGGYGQVTDAEYKLSVTPYILSWFRATVSDLCGAPVPPTTDNKNIILLIVVIVIGVYFLGGK